MKKFFTNTLLNWHATLNKRTMPWKEEKDPYKIWLSEIILQQTRVEQGLSYYNKFVAAYPTIQALAQASDEVVFKLWEGLGYYNRCRNLLVTARLITRDLGGQFPRDYDDILALKGVGKYTAAAIASFAYNLPYAVVDGNVLRVLARYFGKHNPIDNTEGLELFTALAQELLPLKKAGFFNQAIMDYGATVCTPKIARCSSCVLTSKCVAFNKGLVNILPIKSKRLLKKDRGLTYFVFYHQKKILVHLRTEGIWRGLHEFFLLESLNTPLWNSTSIHTFLKTQLGIKQYEIGGVSPVYKQQLTHQNLAGQFIKIHLSDIPPSLHYMQQVSVKAIETLAFPRMINQYLEDNIATTHWQPALF